MSVIYVCDLRISENVVDIDELIWFLKSKKSDIREVSMKVDLTYSELSEIDFELDGRKITNNYTTILKISIKFWYGNTVSIEEYYFNRDGKKTLFNKDVQLIGITYKTINKLYRFAKNLLPNHIYPQG